MAQDYFLYKGKIVEDNSNKPIEGGHVRSSSQQGISDRNGDFEIYVKIGDSISVTHVSYQTFVYFVQKNDTSNIIYLKLLEQELQEVTVSSMPSESEFKQLLISTPYIPSEMEVYLNQNLSYLKTIYRLNNNHLLNAMDHVHQKFSMSNGEVNLFSSNPSLGILGAIRSFRKPASIPFQKSKEFSFPPSFRFNSDTSIRIKNYIDKQEYRDK